MKNQSSRRTFLKASAVAGATVIGAQALPKKAGAKKLAPAYPIPDEPVTKDDYKTLKAMTSEVMAGNRAEMNGHVFHMPSIGKYSSLFGWDAGWHAIAMSRIDPAIAASEMDLLISLQMDSGQISHNTLFGELEKTSSAWSKLGKALGDSQYDDQGRSAMIDPPSYIIACEKVYAQTKDREWLDRILPRLERCVHYMTHDRDLFGDGLVSVIHPWETGTDSSPAYDQILGLDFTTPLGAPRRGLMYPKMLDYNAEFDWDPQEARRRNRFVLEDVTFNSITVSAILSVANLNETIGETGKAEAFREQAKDMVAALDRVNWVESEGCYFSRYNVKNPRLAMRTTCASLLPLMTGLVSKERAERVIREHALNPDEFWLDYLFPFNAADEMIGDKVYMENLLLWRGRCIWINMNWMIMNCLLNYGCREEARELTRRTAKMIRHEGLWEFYDYRNGQGKGQPHFNWPGLVLDMIAVTWPEAVI
jgi:glycogen debranching enzyme